MNKQEKYEEVVNAVELAILQAAELSGLRNWFVWHHLKKLKKGESVNEEAVLQSVCASLMPAFDSAIDPADTKYFESELYRNRNTANEFGGIRL